MNDVVPNLERSNMFMGYGTVHGGGVLLLNKGLLYISMTSKEELEGVLAFLFPSSHCVMALNSIHWNTGHQGQQRTLAL